MADNDLLQTYKLGLADLNQLYQAERQRSAFRLAQLGASRIPGNLDLDHQKAIHQHLFQDVYHWARPSVC